MQDIMIHLVVTGRNNQDFARFNLAGIAGQVLPDDVRLRVTWIDDASDDLTRDRVAGLSDFLEQDARSPVDFSPRFSPRWRSLRQGGLCNILDAVRHSHPQEVIVTWDADDFFASPFAIARIAQEYRDPKCWFTYGGYRTFPLFTTDIRGPYSPGVIASNSFRSADWVCEPPRSFKQFLLDKVPPYYLRDADGKLLDVAYDFALYMSLMELAGSHIRYIPDVLYLYNEGNPLSDWRLRAEKQRANGAMVRKTPRLTPL